MRRLLPIVWLAVAVTALTVMSTVTAQPVWAHGATPVGAPPNEGDDVPVWPFALATIIAVGAGALWAMRRKP
ncbi:hypothetical protein [Mycobacterium angelicum]|uniref:Uncharacterized protein n=1 Tax=Mycobacterium angelicum TaxID=470074 RepID=A0A1W9ZIY8_MYCAN|nr:hypothetical protein [Mycobacterium angelicum]MCV7198917.1 hypothetical protein [Mycobacterium angelicum]ORA16365.1 hypothetical protein BST12_20960 [Mycobacterium angelicum]